mmetsp:Transcript_12713/g.40562  ORF Transcript_12713/g.40562 Transcript_12713/m.40562 type:complete len:359 (-) Transcript_12713:133-1209(-)
MDRLLELVGFLGSLILVLLHRQLRDRIKVLAARKRLLVPPRSEQLRESAVEAPCGRLAHRHRRLGAHRRVGGRTQHGNGAERVVVVRYEARRGEGSASRRHRAVETTEVAEVVVVSGAASSASASSASEVAESVDGAGSGGGGGAEEGGLRRGRRRRRRSRTVEPSKVAKVVAVRCGCCCGGSRSRQRGAHVEQVGRQTGRRKRLFSKGSFPSARAAEAAEVVVGEERAQPGGGEGGGRSGRHREASQRVRGPSERARRERHPASASASEVAEPVVRRRSRRRRRCRPATRAKVSKRVVAVVGGGNSLLHASEPSEIVVVASVGGAEIAEPIARRRRGGRRRRLLRRLLLAPAEHVGR